MANVNWAYCHDCQVARGGKLPEGPNAITCHEGMCLICKNPKASLVPNSDYNWPKIGKKAVWD